MKVVASPTKDTFYAGFTFDLVNLITHDNFDSVFITAQGSILSNLRMVLVDSAIATRATHLLFVDSDMRFPPDTMKRLLNHKVDVVGANCKQRQQDEFTARVDGKFLNSKDLKGIQEVDTIGFGVTLLKLDLFKKLKKPYFAMPFDPVNGKHITDDVYFCHIAKEAGIKIHVDHDLSKDVRHAGMYEFGI